MNIREWLPSFGMPILHYDKTDKGLEVYEVINLGNRLEFRLLAVL